MGEGGLPEGNPKQLPWLGLALWRDAEALLGIWPRSREPVGSGEAREAQGGANQFDNAVKDALKRAIAKGKAVAGRIPKAKAYGPWEGGLPARFGLIPPPRPRFWAPVGPDSCAGETSLSHSR